MQHEITRLTSENLVSNLHYLSNSYILAVVKVIIFLVLGSSREVRQSGRGVQEAEETDQSTSEASQRCRL